MSSEFFLNFVYIISSILFAFGLKFLGSPVTARRGNMLSSLGMLLAVVATLFAGHILHFQWILIGIIIGASLGALVAFKAAMTQMPQMIALLHGCGALASVFVDWTAYRVHGATDLTNAITLYLSIVIGGLTVTGSAIAWGKLSEKISGKPILFTGQKWLNTAIIAAIFILGVLFILQPARYDLFLIILGLSAVFGIFLVIPIGGADMPVVISVLNSYSGVVACTTGFVIHNTLLIVVGSLVGANGIILSIIMCKAMNRSITNVLFGAFGNVVKKSGVEEKKEAKAISVEDAFLILENAKSVVVIPGYGMAVAQAQHAVRELSEFLEKNGCDVKYAIHPVAGRMPGHMNVLLAEANIPYDQLMEMDAINPLMDSMDVAIVIGANDVVNPASRHDKSSPIYGMPIINADKAKTVFVLKRSMATGFAGIENELFYYDNTRMIFGDAKQTVQALVAEFKKQPAALKEIFMATKINQRKEERLKYKNTIQYEECLGGGAFGTPVATESFDITARGIGFYANREFKLGTQLKISTHISNTENIFFFVSVVRLQLYKTDPVQYIVGSEIKSIHEQDKEKLDLFLQEINIYALLDKINLENVMDIHFMAGYPITLKTQGKLKTVGRVLDEYTTKNLLLNLLDEDAYSRFMKIKDINFIVTYKEKRLRFNMHLQQGKVEAICRIVNSKVPTLPQLGLPQSVETLIKSHTKGLILIAGRTGAGKTTTLASLINYLSKIKSGVIISIEDPIEYIQEKNQCIIKQREIGRDTVSYASALQNALRQNPDVLVIGETLNAETMELVMTAAESGALVLTTLHSASAIQVLDRIASFFPMESQKHILTRLSLILRGIIVQELFPRLIGDESLVLAVEVVLINETGKKIIRDGDWKLVPDYILRGRNQGMQTMKDSIENLVNKGIIDMAFSREFLPIYNST